MTCLFTSASSTDAAVTTELRRLPAAPLARRFAALAYEGVVYSALILVAGFLTIPLLPAVPPDASDVRIPDAPARLLSLVLVFAVGGLFYAWSWTGGRRTLPMKTWRMWLMRTDGAELEIRTALVRYVAAWIGPVSALVAYLALRKFGLGPHALWLIGLNFLWAFVDPDGRFLHDRIAGTRIVSESVPQRVTAAG